MEELAMETLDKERNPLKLENEETKFIDDIEDEILLLLEDFSIKEKLSVEEKKSIATVIISAVMQKRTEAYLNAKLHHFNNRMCNTVSRLIREGESNKDIYNRDVFYVKNTKHTRSYE